MLKNILAAGVLLACCGSAFACTSEGEPRTVYADLTTWEARNMVTSWEGIREDMALLDQTAEGQALRSYQGRINIVTTTHFFWEPMETTNIMEKRCDQTLEDAANEQVDNANRIMNPPDTGNNGGGPGGGPMWTPVIIRGYNTWQFGCTVGGRPISCDGN